MIRDISQPLSASTPAWPGDTPFDARRTWTLDDACPVNVSRYTASTHAGTHADAPLHYDPAGIAIDAVALDAYIGPAQVIDVRDAGTVITTDILMERLIPGMERILLRSYARFPHEQWDADAATVDAAAIVWLAGQGVRLIGIDGPSLDPQESKTMDAHLAVRAADMRILEGLVLDGVEAGCYELIALPLPLAGLDAAPVRAILRDLP